MNQELYDAIEKLKSTGMPVKRAFEAYADQHGVKASSIQAAYYQHKKALRPVEPDTLSGRLRTLTSEVAELESLVEQYEAIRRQK